MLLKGLRSGFEEVCFSKGSLRTGEVSRLLLNREARRLRGAADVIPRLLMSF